GAPLGEEGGRYGLRALERDRPGRVGPAADRGLVGDRAANSGAGRLLAGVDHRAAVGTALGDHHLLRRVVIVAGGEVVAVAARVGGVPLVGARHRPRGG